MQSQIYFNNTCINSLVKPGSVICSPQLPQTIESPSSGFSPFGNIKYSAKTSSPSFNSLFDNNPGFPHDLCT